MYTIMTPNLLINLTQTDIENNPFIKDGQLHFYRFLIERITGITYDPKKIKTVDCTKISISRNISEYWKETVEKDSSMAEDDFAFLMFIHGPKVNENLRNNQILLEPYSIITKDGTNYPQALIVL